MQLLEWLVAASVQVAYQSLLPQLFSGDHAAVTVVEEAAVA